MIKCDNCNSTDTYVNDYEHIYSYKGQKVEFVLKRRFCKKCNSLVHDAELDNKALEEGLRLYNELYGIPGSKIKDLRKCLNLSQELFSRIIGCAKKTLISYELGTSIPNDIYAIIINSIIEKPEIILTFISVNKRNFTNKEYDRIINNVNNYLDSMSACDDLNEFNGYTELSNDKVKSMILYFSNKGILKTKLLKEMFYADFLYYQNVGKSITGLEYVKLNYGPVPSDHEKIIDEMASDGLIDYKVEFNLDYESHNIRSIKNYDKNAFSSDELETIKRVKDYFKKFNSHEIVEYSYEENAFIKLNFHDKISYEYACDMKRNI